LGFEAGAAFAFEGADCFADVVAERRAVVFFELVVFALFFEGCEEAGLVDFVFRAGFFIGLDGMRSPYQSRQAARCHRRCEAFVEV
jgi:hypothetical protein